MKTNFVENRERLSSNASKTMFSQSFSFVDFVIKCVKISTIEYKSNNFREK